MDVRSALQDLAHQVRAARARDGLTLQQLATRCGVAASTIHKIESQQMVPTVSVVLKIARGLGCSPKALVRDRPGMDEGRDGNAAGAARPTDARPAAQAPRTSASAPGEIGVHRLVCRPGETISPSALEPGQRATLLVETGGGVLRTDSNRMQLLAGACVEIEGEAFHFDCNPSEPARVLLILSPA